MTYKGFLFLCDNPNHLGEPGVDDDRIWINEGNLIKARQKARKEGWMIRNSGECICAICCKSWGANEELFKTVRGPRKQRYNQAKQLPGQLSIESVVGETVENED